MKLLTTLSLLILPAYAFAHGTEVFVFFVLGVLFCQTVVTIIAKFLVRTNYAKLCFIYLAIVIFLWILLFNITDNKLLFTFLFYMLPGFPFLYWLGAYIFYRKTLKEE